MTQCGVSVLERRFESTTPKLGAGGWSRRLEQALRATRIALALVDLRWEAFARRKLPCNNRMTSLSDVYAKVRENK
jgi:hypothetical protein